MQRSYTNSTKQEKQRKIVFPNRIFSFTFTKTMDIERHEYIK